MQKYLNYASRHLGQEKIFHCVINGLAYVSQPFLYTVMGKIAILDTIHSAKIAYMTGSRSEFCQ